jgi:hypothetical protein
MKANEKCIWNNDCSYQNTTGCPLEKFNYVETREYKDICTYFITKESLSETCPPCSFTKEEVLFNVTRKYCEKCGAEKKGSNSLI